MAGCHSHLRCLLEVVYIVRYIGVAVLDVPPEDIDMFCRSGMLMDGQLSTRNMVNAVNEEFWKMVKGSIDEQTVVFSGMSCAHRNQYLFQVFVPIL